MKLLGLRTCIYKVSDLSKAKDWYSKALGSQPYFDQPFYVGFSVQGYELGLIPEEKPQTKSTCVSTYLGVENVENTYQNLLK